MCVCVWREGTIHTNQLKIAHKRRGEDKGELNEGATNLSVLSIHLLLSLETLLPWKGYLDYIWPIPLDVHMHIIANDIFEIHMHGQTKGLRLAAVHLGTDINLLYCR